MRRAPMLAVGALAVACSGCGGLTVTPAASVPATAAAMATEPVATPAPTLNLRPRPTVPAQPTGTPLPFLPDLDAVADKQLLTEHLNFICGDGDGADQRLWTCSYRDEVDISVYGVDPPHVTAIRVVTDARQEVNRRSWIRGYASAFGVDVWQWAEDHFGSHALAKVGDVWVQMTHDAKSDGVLISTKELGP